MGIAIKVENLGKAYQLGEIGTGTISRDLERYLAKLRGKEDPFLKVGESNDRTKKGESDIVWSLKDLNFEIEQGDAVGIIGRNGAGKSTLLKILSRVTSPTTGSVKIKGRVASLLEVGTGFHPELTGKENIFLNGAILGMRKTEVKKHFDAIVDFAGIERYVDTPVKRYSSGMYVRLAFAVAAHLESEILVVDEVLAVGDAEFQKKCIGKMSDVSKGEGRTVLFVSHNLESVRNLTTKSLLLNNGQLQSISTTNDIIREYTSLKTNNLLEFSNLQLDTSRKIECIKANYEKVGEQYININIDYIVREKVKSLIAIELFNQNDISIFTLKDIDIDDENYIKERGKYTTCVRVPIDLLAIGEYSITISFAEEGIQRFHLLKNCLTFEVIENLKTQNASYRNGVLRLVAKWYTKNN